MSDEPVTAERLLAMLEAHQAAELKRRRMGPWRPGLAAPIEWNVSTVGTMPLGGRRAHRLVLARQLLDELTAAGKLKRIGGNGPTGARRAPRWRLA